MSVLRIHANGDVTIKGKLHIEWTALNDTDNVNDARNLDEIHKFNDINGTQELFKYLLGITDTQMAVNKTFIDIHGELVTPVLKENQANTTFKNNGITLKGILIEEGL